MEEKVLIEEKDLIEIKQSSQDVELFKDYEVNKFKITPSLYKIVIASFLINTVFGFSLSQMDLFQQKACDSAYIGKVCQVLDAAYVGSKFFGTTRTTVDEPYEKTEFDTADITWVDVSNKELFQYPEGYFFKEEPVQEPLAGNEFAMVNGGDGKSTNPGAFLPPGANPFTTTPSNPTTTIPNNPTTTTPPSTKLDIKKPPVLPKQNNQMKPSDFDGLSIVNTVNSGEKTSTPKKKDEPKKTPNDNNTAGVDPKDKQPTSDKTSNETKKVDEIVINKKAIKDLGYAVLGVKDKSILEKPFSLTAKGKLTKEGKLDKQTKFSNAQGDEQMIGLVQQAVASISDSGYLKYLEKLSGKDLTLSLQQDDANITGLIESEIESDSQARSIASALNLVMSVAKSNKTSPDDKDDLTLLQNAKVEAQGKKLILKFVIPRPIAKEMITRQLENLAKEPQTTLDSKQTGQNLAK